MQMLAVRLANSPLFQIDFKRIPFLSRHFIEEVLDDFSVKFDRKDAVLEAVVVEYVSV